MLCIRVVCLALRLCIASPDSCGSLSAYSHNVSTIALMNNIHALIHAQFFISVRGGRRRCDAVRKESQSNERRATWWIKCLKLDWIFCWRIPFIIDVSCIGDSWVCAAENSTPAADPAATVACSAASLSSLLLELETFQSPRVKKCRETRQQRHFLPSTLSDL